jgi:hypothetical protein
MALTPDIIKANENLASLTAEQLSAIATLSANDEATVISTKTGEHHGRVEQDVKEIAGVDKNAGEKSYDYLKRVLGDFKERSTGTAAVQTKLDAELAKIAGLEQKILDGKGNEAVAQRLKDSESKLAALQGQYETEKTGWATERTGFADQITGIQVNSEIAKATAGLKFKASYPVSVQSTLLKAAKDTVLGSYKPDWVEENGVKVMVFRDDKGEVIRNKANGLNPYTSQELIAEQLKDVLETGKNQPGGGTGKPGGPDQVTISDLSGAKSQVDADSIIVKHLLQLGLTRGSAEFGNKQKELRQENNISKLPIR